MNGLQVPSVFMRYNLWKYTDFEVEMHEAPFAVDSMRHCSRVGRAGSDIWRERSRVTRALRSSTPRGIKASDLVNGQGFDRKASR